MKVVERKVAARLPWLRSLSITAAGLCAVAGLGVVDYHTPGPLSFLLFYLLVVVLVARYAGKWPAIIVSSTAAITLATVQWGLQRGLPLTLWEGLWNNVTRFILFSLAAWLTAEVTRLNRHLSDLVDERTAQWKAESERHQTTSTRLAEALERFEQVVNNIAEVFWLTDVAKNQMVYVSPGYERIWGRKCEELYREPRSWAAAIHPADRDKILQRAQTEQAVGGYDVEYRILRPDGAVRWIRDRAFPVRNEQGEVCRIAGIAQDITERKQTREMLHMQAAILENMAEGVVVTDEQGVIVQMNPAGERIWGYDRNEVVGQPASVFSALPEPQATTVMLDVLETMQAAGFWRGTFKNRRKDGAIIMCEAVINRVEVQGGVLLVAVEQDVTERVRAEEQLQMQARVLESMAEAMMVVDETGTIVLTNPAQDALLGYERGELAGKSMLLVAGYSAEGYRPLFARHIQAVKEHGFARGDYPAKRKDGTLIEVETRSSGMSFGGRFCLIIVGQDITARKQAQQALQQSEETLRTFLNALPEPALLMDRNGTLLASNQAFARSPALPEGELIGKHVFSLFPPKLAEPRKALFDQVIRTREQVQFEDTRDGRHLMNFVSPVLDPAGNVTRVAVFALDITERKQTEAVLRQSEQTYRSLVETTGTGYLILDLAGRVQHANAEYVRLSGHQTLQEILGRSVTEWTAPEDRERNAAAVKECLKTGVVRNLEVAYAGPSGLITPVEINGTVVDTAKGKAILSLCRDITQRKQAESALASQEALYRTLFELSPDGILLEDDNGNILDANQALCRSFGYAPEDLLHQNVRWFVPPERQSDVDTHLATLRTGQTLEHEVWNIRRDGERRLMRLNETPLTLPDGRQGILVVARDITGSKRAEVTQQVFLSLGAKLSEARTSVEAAQAVYDAADDLWRWDTSTLLLYSPESETMEPVLYRDIVDGQRRDVPAVLPGGAPTARMRRIMRQGAELLLRRATDQPDPEVVMFGDTSRSSASVMCVPMRRQGQPVGVLSIQSYTPDAYTQEDLRTLQALADHCGGALERIRTEQALQQRETLNRSILATAMDGFYALDFGPDPQGAITEVNEAFCRLTGYSREELLRMRIADLEAQESLEEVARHKERIVAGGNERFETRHRSKDGQEIQVEISLSWLAGTQRMFGFVRDITERKRAEVTKEVFLSLGAKLSVVQTPVEAGKAVFASADQLWHWDAATLDLYSQEKDWVDPVLFYDVVGGERREVPSALPAGPPTPRLRRIIGHGAELLLRKEADMHSPDSVTFGDASRLSASIMSVPIRREGRPVGILSIQSYTPNAYTPEDLRTLQALTDHCGGALDRIRAEQSLQQREELNRTILATAMDGFYAVDFTTDPQGAITEVNEAYCRLIGYSREELLRMRVTDVEAQESPEELARHKARIMAAGGERFETRHRHKDGREIHVEVSVTSFSGGSRMFSFIRDITERKRAELAKEAFLSLGAKLSTVSTPLEAARAIYASADLLWKWDSAMLDLCEPGSRRLQAVLNCDVVDGQRREVLPVKPGGNPSPRMLRIMRDGAQLILEDQPTQTSDFEVFGDTSRLSASMMYVPLRQEGRAVGVLSIQSYTPNAYTQEDLRTLQALADHCGGALERINAEAALRENEELLRAFYDSPGGLRGIVELLDDDILVTSANASQAAAYGRTVEGMNGVLASELGVARPVIDLWLAKMRECQQSDKPVTFEYSADFRTPGSWGLATAAPLHLARGNRPRLAFIAVDITERKRAEQMLREAHDLLEQRVQERTAELRAANEALGMSEQKYRRLHESMTDAFISTDMRGRITEFNPAYEALLGYTPDELRTLTYVDLTPEKWHALEARIVADQILPRGHSDVYEKEYRRKNGTVFPVEMRTFLIRDAHGQPASMWAIVRDITERKRVERALREAHDQLERRVQERTAELQAANAALRESEERYRSLVNNLNVGVYRNTPGSNGRFIHTNPALARMHGYDSVEEFQKVSVADLYQEAGQRKAFLAEILRQGAVVNYEVPLKKKDGTAIYAMVNATVHRGPNGEPDWIDGVIEDITQRRQAEKALRASEERYRALAESSPDAIFILDRDILIQYANSTAARLWGRRPEDCIGLAQPDLFPLDVAQYHCETVAEVFKTGKAARRDELLTFTTGDRWIEIRLVPLYGEEGAVSSVMAMCRDFTDRKRAEQQLAEALDLNQKMIAASTLGIAAYRASGECVFANEGLARAVGGTLGEVLQGNFRRLKSWQGSGLLKLAEETLSKGQAWSGEVYTTTRFGKTVWLDCHIAPFVSNGQPHLLLMALDITERKRSEGLLQTQRDLGVRLSLTSDLNAALNELIEIAMHVEAVDCGGIYLIDPSSGQLNLAVHRGLAKNFVVAASHIAADTPQAKLVRAGQPVYQDYNGLPIVPSPAEKGEGLRAIAVVPLSHEGTILGCVNLASHQLDDLPLQSRVLIESVAAQAAGAIVRIRAEEALRQSETRLRAIISSAPVMLFAVDRDGIIRFEDGQAIKTLGMSPGANVGRSVMEVYGHAPAMVENARRALRGEKFECLVEAGPITLDCWYSPMHDKEGKPAGYIGVATNITERRRLERQILEISDREQARIGQDIHDGLCQQLVSLAFDANTLQGVLSEQRRPEVKTARRIAVAVDRAITETRQLARGLFPVRLETDGLPPALEQLAEATGARFKIRCRFHSQGPVAVQDTTMATHLYRIAQEALTNAVKHSQAKRVSIHLKAGARQLELRVEDDGAGLSSATRSKATGMGLHIMDYRARAIGGTLHLAPGRRGGTVVSCCIPTAGAKQSNV